MKNQFLYLNILALIPVVVLVSCSKGGGGNDQSSASQVVFESPHCNDIRSFSDPVTLSGVAHFQYRPVNTVNTSQGTIRGLSGDPVTDNISYAEMMILNSAGEIIQCGTTNDDGTFQISVPKGAGDLTIKVLSRAFNSKIKASVLEDQTINSPYALQKSTSVGNDPINLGEFLALARMSQSSKMEGGAFNIFKSIYKANDYIRTQTANAAWVAEKVTVYWKAGFNPYSYFGYPDSMLSFYKPGDRKLYILGGYNGNVSTADTDHFDPAVILHEYGHFLEDVYGKTDSPGGYHNGDAVIDPRLAWSEGFANFFQGAVLSKNYYLDTAGFCNDSIESGSCSQNVYITLSDDAATASFDRMPAATTDGEGSFREISISRTLYKIISTASSSHPLGAGIPFKEIWNIFSDGTTGYHSAGQSFRSTLLLNKSIDLVISSNYSSKVTYWNNIVANEKQSKTNKHYANTFNEQALNSCSQSLVVAPVQDKTVCSGSYCPIYKHSNQFKSNDFYRLDVTQADIDSNATISMTYSQSNSSYPVDLDLYLYKQDYTYFEEYQEKESGEQSQSIVKRGARIYGALENGYESISLGGLTPGVYMLVVKASTYNKTSAGVGVGGQYVIQKTVNSTQRDLCPIN